MAAGWRKGGGKVATYGRTNETDVAVLRTAGAVRQRRRSAKSREVREGAGRIIAAYSRYCSAHSVPAPSRMDIAILSTQAANLLAGGYDEVDVNDEALQIASEFNLFQGHRGMTQLQRRVQQKYDDRHLAEHEELKNAEVAPDVAAAIGAVKRVPSKYAPRDPRPVKAALPSLRSVGQKCSCGHYAVEHGKSRCQTCDRIGRECAA